MSKASACATAASHRGITPRHHTAASHRGITPRHGPQGSLVQYRPGVRGPLRVGGSRCGGKGGAGGGREGEVWLRGRDRDARACMRVSSGSGGARVLRTRLDVDDSPHVWASTRPARLVYLTRATASAWPSRVALACSDRALGLGVVGCAIPCATRHMAQRREEGLARGRRSVVALRIPILLTVLG